MFGGIKTMWQAARGKELYKGGGRSLGVGLPINLAAAVALSGVASAEEATDKGAAKSLVEAFVSTCVQSVPNIDQVEKTAKLFGWKEIKGLEGTLLAPENPNVKGKAWLVEGFAQVPFMLGISSGNVEGEFISTCTVANPHAPVAPVLSALVQVLNLGEPLNVETEGGQKYTYWQTTFSGRNVLVSLIDATPSNDPGVDLSAAVKEVPH